MRFLRPCRARIRFASRQARITESVGVISGFSSWCSCAIVGFANSEEALVAET
jgi:hypothetical protein